MPNWPLIVCYNKKLCCLVMNVHFSLFMGIVLINVETLIPVQSCEMHAGLFISSGC